MQDAEVTVWTKWGGTKFVLVLLVVIWAMFMMERGLHPDEKLLDLIVWVVGIFMGANVGKAGLDAYRLSKAPTPAPGASDAK